jgi:hypothetical protein
MPVDLQEVSKIVSLPTPWALIFFQKLTVIYVVKKFPPFMKARKCIVLFIGIAESSYLFPLKDILILSVSKPKPSLPFTFCHWPTSVKVMFL